MAPRRNSSSQRDKRFKATVFINIQRGCHPEGECLFSDSWIAWGYTVNNAVENSRKTLDRVVGYVEKKHRCNGSMIISSGFLLTNSLGETKGIRPCAFVLKRRQAFPRNIRSKGVSCLFKPAKVEDVFQVCGNDNGHH